MKNLIIQYILKRLTETSTIRGIVLTLASISGMTLTQDQTNSAVWIVLGIIGILGSLLPDNFKKVVKDNVPTEVEEQNPESGEDIHVPEPPYKKPEPTNDAGFNDK